MRQRAKRGDEKGANRSIVRVTGLSWPKLWCLVKNICRILIESFETLPQSKNCSFYGRDVTNSPLRLWVCLCARCGVWKMLTLGKQLLRNHYNRVYEEKKKKRKNWVQQLSFHSKGPKASLGFFFASVWWQKILNTWDFYAVFSLPPSCANHLPEMLPSRRSERLFFSPTLFSTARKTHTRGEWVRRKNRSF